jgi:hypothetical protein
VRANERFRFVAIVGLVVALLTAGISLAGDAIETPDEPHPTICAPGHQAGNVDEGCQTGDHGTTEEPATETADAVDGPGTKDVHPSDCAGAAHVAGDVPTERPVPGELHGIENASAHVLWNCLDHPNHGLVNALTKLHERLDAWLERRAERAAAKTERQAAQAAAKAARDAARGASKAARELNNTGS